MNARFGVAIAVVVLAVGLLVMTAVRQTAKPVVTVHELAAEKTARSNVRLGARVADAPITVENGTVRFAVRDIEAGAPVGSEIEIAYLGALPDTLRSGRDVILEGDFDPAAHRFSARVLQTQCPSKYVPPTDTGARTSSDGRKDSTTGYGGAAEGVR